MDTSRVQRGSRKLGCALLLALVYYISGKLGLLLAVPPGFATAIWPPSGISIAAALIFGNWIVTGAFLGSLSLNLHVGVSEAFTMQALRDAMPVAFGLACGSTLYIWASASLIRRFCYSPKDSIDERRIVFFLLIAGPLGSLISATIGVSVLSAGGVIAPAAIPYNGFTWWVGDSIGALIFAPLAIIFGDWLKSERKKILAVVVLPLVCIFVVTLLAYRHMSRREWEKAEKQFARQVENLADTLDQRLSLSMGALRGLQAYLSVEERISKERFARYAGELLKKTPGVHALHWVPRAESHEAIPGFDLESESEIRGAIERARVRGNVTLSAPVPSVEGGRGVLAFAPVYRSGSSGIREFVGAASGMIQPNTLIKGIESDRIKRGGLSSDGFLVLSERGVLGEDTFLASSLGEWERVQSRLAHARQGSIRSWTVGFQFADKEWLLTAYEPSSSVFSRTGFLLWSIQAAGLLFCGIFGAFLLVLGIRGKRVSDLVEEKVQQVERQRLQLQHASFLASLGEIAGGIAHEINNPLAIIQGSAEQVLLRLEREDVRAESVKKAVEKIVSTSQRISKIIKGLRVLARDGSGDPFVVVSVKELFSDVLSFCEAKFKSHQVELRMAGEIERIQVRCQVVTLSQAILNLVTNAYDAVEGKPGAWVELSASEDGDDVLIRVMDSGSGIPKETAQKLFQPFFTTKGVGKGTGLGLGIARGIAETHGGTLYLDDSMMNTCFCFRLPQRNISAGGGRGTVSR